MAALILPSRRVVQPQGPVDIDWANPLSRGLVDAFVNGISVRNTGSGSSTSGVSRSTIAAGVGPTYTSTGFTEFPDQNLKSPQFTSLALYQLRNTSGGRVSGYFASASYGHVFLPNATNFRFLFSTTGTNNTIVGSAISTKEKVDIGTYDGVVGSYYENGVLSGSLTGSFNSSGGRNFRLGSVDGSAAASACIPLAMVFNRALAPSEARELAQNPWQLFKPIERRIWVGVAGGPTPVAGIATGTPASLTLSSAAASAAGKAQASATPANLSLFAPTATASVTPTASAGNAVGTPAPLALSALSATAAGKAAASAAPASLNISAPAATAAGKAAATATPASVSLSAPPAIATGKAQATSTPAQITISAPTAIAFGGAAGVAIGAPASVSLSAPEAAAKGSAVASAMYAGVSLSAPTATASATPSGAAGFAFGTPAGISLLPAEATARGAAQASAAYAGISISAPTGTASASDARGFAVGAFASLTLSAPEGVASVFDPSAFVRAPDGGGFTRRQPDSSGRPSRYTAGRTGRY